MIIIIKHHKILIDKKLICLKIINGGLNFINIFMIKSWLIKNSIRFILSLEHDVMLEASKTLMNRNMYIIFSIQSYYVFE